MLQWLKDQPSRCRPFVANRCASIHDDVPEARWHYVKFKENPADVISRGCAADELLHNDLWWQWPAWLKSEVSPWTFIKDESLKLGDSS